MHMAGPGYNMRNLSFIVALVATLADIGSATAQTYPSRPITIIVPFAAGGTLDITARIIGEHMSRTLGQQIVVENIVGAGGTIGSTRAMRAGPDGYTIELGHMGTHAFAPALYPNLAYKPDTDFQPIGTVSTNPMLIVARDDFLPKDLREFISFVKANENRLNVSHAGVGSVFFTTCLLLNALLDVSPTFVPFNGGAPAMNALLVPPHSDYDSLL
jgi:tripartite-type tricarboxylate transporter receptor subunit TctC